MVGAGLAGGVGRVGIVGRFFRELSIFAERTDSFVVKTRSGRYAKLSLQCNCPGGFVATVTGVGAQGMRFGWSLAAAGSTM